MSRCDQYDESPLPVQGLYVTVGAAQVVDEGLEHALVVQQLETGFVVHLESDHCGMVVVAPDDGTDHALGVETVGGVRQVHFLTGPPSDALSRASLSGDLGVLARQPQGYGVRGGTQYDGDPSRTRAVQDRLQPVKVEHSVLWLPGGPGGLAHPDHGEPSFLHEVEVLVEPGGGLVLVVVRGAEEHAVVKVCQGNEVLIWRGR